MGLSIYALWAKITERLQAERAVVSACCVYIIVARDMVRA